MSNKHSRLKALEKLAAIAKSKAKSQSLKIESDRLQAKYSEMSSEELNAAYQLVQDELKAQPIDSAILNLTTQELIQKYTQLCQDSK